VKKTIKMAPSILSADFSQLGRDVKMIADSGADMINKSRGNAAYTMIDIDGEAHADIREELMGIEGVIRVRLID
jgi:D-3-phosphoglycerate dehydrogenase